MFAACDRSTVIYSRNSKLIFSIVNTPDCTGMAPFHSNLFPDCLAMISERGFMIGAVDNIQKIHIQSYPLGQSPRRICHSDLTGMYAVSVTKIEQGERGEQTSDSLLFLDDGNMAELGFFELDPLETGLSLHVSSCGMPGRQLIVLGTAYSIPEENDPTRGRILVFEMDSERRPILVAEKEVKGAVFSIDSIAAGKLVTGISSKVRLYRLVQRDDGTKSFDLQYECGHQGHFLSLYVKARKDYVLVGDLMRSVSLLEYKLADGTLQEVSRDFNTNYMRAIDIIDDNHFVGTEDKGNIFIVRRPVNPETDEEKGKLEMQTEYHLGDFINVFRRGCLNSQPQEMEAPHGSVGGGASGASVNQLGPESSLLFGTVNGMIGSLFTISEETFHFFQALEKALKTVITGAIICIFSHPSTHPHVYKQRLF